MRQKPVATSRVWVGAVQRRSSLWPDAPGITVEYVSAVELVSLSVFFNNAMSNIVLSAIMVVNVLFVSLYVGLVDAVFDLMSKLNVCETKIFLLSMFFSVCSIVLSESIVMNMLLVLYMKLWNDTWDYLVCYLSIHYLMSTWCIAYYRRSVFATMLLGKRSDKRDTDAAWEFYALVSLCYNFLH